MLHTSCLHAFATSLFRVIHTQTPGLCPTLFIVHGWTNIPCNAKDVHKEKLSHTCLWQAHNRLIAHALAMYVMPVVFSGCYDCMCGDTLTIPRVPSLSLCSAQPWCKRACLSIFIYGETNKQFRASGNIVYGETGKIQEIALSLYPRQDNYNVNKTKSYNWISSKLTPVDAS